MLFRNKTHKFYGFSIINVGVQFLSVHPGGAETDNRGVTGVGANTGQQTGSPGSDINFSAKMTGACGAGHHRWWWRGGLLERLFTDACCVSPSLLLPSIYIYIASFCIILNHLHTVIYQCNLIIINPKSITYFPYICLLTLIIYLNRLWCLKCINKFFVSINIFLFKFEPWISRLCWSEQPGLKHPNVYCLFQSSVLFIIEEHLWIILSRNFQFIMYILFAIFWIVLHFCYENGTSLIFAPIFLIYMWTRLITISRPSFRI